mmetsp:Transcript_16514/g.39169  ORF Transcript_16514/g.39169 Transcript_16514/m.39169 type:complete len:237 (-) Transcript_16514:1754-2464(-)
MHLQQELPPELPEAGAPVDGDHGRRRDVRGRALDGRVDGGALRVAAQRLVVRVDTGENPPPTDERAHVPMLLGLISLPLLPLLHLPPVRVPTAHSFFSLMDARVEVFGKSVRRLPVGDAEVKHLGFPPLAPVLVLDERHRRRLSFGVVPLEEALPAVNSFPDVVVHAERSPRVEVAPELKGLEHGLAAGHVCEQPKLELPVVGDHEGLPLPRGECLADLVTVLLEGRLVLKVGAAC